MMGLLLAALGGAAEQGIDSIDAHEKASIQEAHATRMAQFNSELALQRSEALETLRRSRGVEEHQVNQQRLAEQAEAIDTGAADRRTGREVETANKVAPSVDKEVMDFLKTTLPADKLEAAYGVKQATAVDELDDKIAVARQHGFYESENGLRADRRAAQTELTGERREHDRENRTLLLERRIDDNRELSERRLSQQANRSNEGRPPAVVATMEYLKKLGWDEARIEAFVTQKKKSDPAELAAKLARGDKPDGDGKQPRRSLEGDGAHIDSAGNIRDSGGNIIREARRKPGAQPLDSRPPPTQVDVEAFNAAMAAKAKPEPSLMERLFKMGAGK